jgi:DNA-binding CsgD family transcriptional regulator
VYASLGEAATASAALREFDGLAPCPHAERDGGDADPRQAGWYAHVAGLVRRGEGDLRGAAESLHAAVDVFHAHGCRWREVLSLIELDALRGPAPGEFLDRAVAMIAEHFPVSFLVRRLSPWSRAAIDPVVGTLTPAELDVLRHMLDGRCQRDIAHLTGRAYNTVRTQVQGLHRKLGTSSDLQIVAACARRGIGAPSWPFTVRHEPS